MGSSMILTFLLLPYCIMFLLSFLFLCKTVCLSLLLEINYTLASNIHWFRQLWVTVALQHVYEFYSEVSTKFIFNHVCGYYPKWSLFGEWTWQTCQFYYTRLVVQQRERERERAKGLFQFFWVNICADLSVPDCPVWDVSDFDLVVCVSH